MESKMNFEWLLQMLKAVSDEQRLLLLTQFASGEHNVTQIAQMLSLSESTVSHHLTKLREVGLVTLRTDGNQRFYRLNESGMAKFKEGIQQIEQLKPHERRASDSSWLDQLPEEFTAEDKAILRDLTYDGKLRVALPSLRNRKKANVMMRWLASRFEPNRFYTEPEVNANLKAVHEDYASLRRYLIEFGYLRRELGGGKYWRTPGDEQINTDPTELPE